MSVHAKSVDLIEEADGLKLLPAQKEVERADARPATSRSVCTPGKIARFLVFAIASALMYGVFFSSADQLFPLLTSGTTVGAALVIALALAFSFVYGCCANYLLELLGFRELK